MLSVEYIKYIRNRLGATKKARNNIRAIMEEKDPIIKAIKKSLFQAVAIRGDSIYDYINSYKARAIKIAKLSKVQYCHNEPICICAVKDDLLRVKEQVRHHREIGVKHFAYIDNMSTDGTFEWLSEQDDVSLFRVDEQYNSLRRSAWIKSATDLLGYGRWYLILDSDEFFAYPGMERIPINEYIDFLEKENIKCAFTPLIDMYSKGKIYEGDDENFKEEFCFFDASTYTKTKHPWGYLLRGGPRRRAFVKNNGKRYFCLTKYALIKAEKPYVFFAHYHAPFCLNFECENAIAFLLHYKFLPSDEVKYKQISEEGKYNNGSSAYKRYMETIQENTDLTFFHSESKRLNTSMDLMQIDIIDRNYYQKFFNRAN